MDYLPLFHNLRGRRCLVVGGGETALRKVRPLLEAGARVTLVATRIKEGLFDLQSEGDLVLMERGFEAGDIAETCLVVAATDDSELNELISRLAGDRNIPVNVVDNPALCTVIFPSIIDRSPVQIAISTSGTAPVMARLLRGKVEALVPAAYGQLATLAEKFRSRVKQKFPSDNSRRRFWEQVFEGPVAETVFKGNLPEAEKMLLDLFASEQPSVAGEVYLVGGGPGDPELLTFKALRLMQQADVVLYDRLVSKPVLDLVRRDAERIFVGKTAGDHPVSQETINAKLVELASAGHRVLRLKGGDPFIFGRGGEEIENLAARGIPFQVVPGITAASGCASYSGIPLTHRDHAQSVRFITGHRKDDCLDLDWQSLASSNQTLVFYMGLNVLSTVCAQLIAHGVAPGMPVALVEKGTTPEQRVIIGNLESLPQLVVAAEVKAPTLIIVGTVVNLHDQLNWYHP